MRNSKYTFYITGVFAIFILLISAYFLFIYKTNYLEIFSVYYKPAPLIKSDIFTPIQAGRSIVNTPSRKGKFTSEEIDWLNKNMIGDDTGENISDLNRYFAEVTALYWIWKNTDSPYVGMFHYRRFLAINQNHHYPILEFPSMRFIHFGIKHLQTFSKEFLHDMELEKKYILPWFATHDIIISEPIKLNTYQHYKKEHVISDLDSALELIKQKYPYMYDSALKTVHSDNGFNPTNMFIARREVFNNYAEWLFSILLPIYEQKKEELAQRDTEQKLAMAYLAERLFAIYLNYEKEYHHLRVKEVPYALASNFFTPPVNSEYITLEASNWKDDFLSMPNSRICGYNNEYYHCGKYEFLPQNQLKVKWDNGQTSLFRHKQNNIFILAK